jgi:hypothetical protein
MIFCPAKPHSKANVQLLRIAFRPQKLFVSLNFHPEVRGHRFPDCGKNCFTLANGAAAMRTFSTLNQGPSNAM